jgi:hypothetical protein
VRARVVITLDERLRGSIFIFAATADAIGTRLAEAKHSYIMGFFVKGLRFG